ncbi:MAG: DUF4330 domain-containing protein [Firmicutes bacterium]|nr:DUF4330 domain-containing protein [Bacillota bacterium]
MKKNKFTVIDALIIIFVVAAFGVAVLKLKPGVFNKSEERAIQFTVMVSEADEGTSDIIKSGDEVSISFSEKAYATVKSVSEEPYVTSTFSPTMGKYVSNKMAGKSNLIINLECIAEISDTHIMNGEVPIRVGSGMPVRGKGYTVKGYVIDVQD